MAPAPFEITERDGVRFASNAAQTLQLTEQDGRVFRRRAIKNIGTGQPQPVEWIVAEVAGVRVYFDGSHVIVSRQDLNP